MPRSPFADPTPPPGGGSSHLQALIALGQSLAGASRPATVAELAARTIEETLQPDAVLVVLSDTQTRDRTVTYATPPADARPDDPLIELAMKRPRVISGAAAAPFRSWIGVPIKVAAGRTIGAVSIGSAQTGRFDDADLELAVAVVTQAGIALENARLLELLSEGKRQWEQTVDAVQEAFCVVDANGVVRRANRSFAALARHPLTALSGRPWISLLPEAWTTPVATALAGQESGSVELLADGRLYTVSVLRLGGDAGFSVLAFSDQTDKKRLQEQLIQSEKMSAIGQLIAGVAHDLNNPLASVVGFADYLLETEKNAPSHLVEPLRAIQQEAERAAGIVHNLLSFARKQDRGRHSQPLGPVLEATLTLLRNQLMACKVQGHLTVDPGLPDVAMDANQIQQVFVNLINNAAQAISAAGHGDNVWIRAARWLDGVVVTVDDDGPGVADGIADKVFEPFFTTKPEGQGTGLGLSICQGIVKEHGGRIALGKQAGGGASFRVELPGAAAPAAAPADGAPAATGQLRVLVVDDEPHILHYMRATLETWGHTVAVAADGADALSRTRAEPFDLIITDIRMPQVGGRELYNALLQERPDLASRVVFSTGDTIRGDTLAFLEALGRPYLRKPFSLGQLRNALGSVAARPGYSSRAP